MHTPTKHPRPLARLTAVLVLALLGATLAPVAAQAAEGDVTWTVRTASNSYGADRTSYHYTAAPGSKLTDAIVVTNKGDTPLDLGVYAADGYTTSSGQLDLLLPDAKQRGIGAWVHTGTDRVSVAPGQSVDVPFTVQVPTSGTPGDYAGGIVTSLTEPSRASGINVDRRLGIRISLRVSGAIKPGLAIEHPKVHWAGGLNPFAGGDATLSYTIRNTGNATLGARQSAGSAGPFGWFRVKAGKIADPPELLPGESRKVTVPIRDVPASFWLSTTASVTPVFVDASGSSTLLDPLAAHAASWALPWMLIVIVLVLAALVVGVVLLRRRRRARAKAREDARVQEAVDRALAEAKEKEPAKP